MSATNPFPEGSLDESENIRVAAALSDASKLQVPEMVWVTHAGVIRAVQFLLASGMRRRILSASEWPASAIGMGEWLCVEV